MSEDSGTTTRQSSSSSERISKEQSKKKQEEKLKKEMENKRKEDERIKKELEKKKKEQEKLQEKKKKEEERLLKEKQKEDERRKKESERLRKEQEKEEERKKKEDERLKKEQEKENEKKMKEAERLKKEEERIKKKLEREEELKKKEDERIRKELEKQRDEEERLEKKKRQSAVLLNFIIKESKDKDTSFNPVSSDGVEPGRFMQFILKKDQKMPPINRVSEEVREDKKRRLDKEIGSNDNENILTELKTRKRLTYPDTCPLTKPQDIICFEDVKNQTSQWLKAKLYQFIENNRPAYYGSWRRRSRLITGRHPFYKDEQNLNYEIDSDEEWEEEEPGESIASSDNEEEEDEKAESDEDDFLVPHGYLSDDEGVIDDEEEEKEKVAECAVDDERKMKEMRQKLSLAVYEAAHERSSQKLKPKLFGCLWVDHNNNDNDLLKNKENMMTYSGKARDEGHKSQQMKRFEVQLTERVLLMFKAHVWPGEKTPITIMNTIPEVRVETKPKKNVKTLPDECTPYLVALVHNSRASRKNLTFEFRSFWHKKLTGKLPLVLDFKIFTSLNNPNNSSDKNFVEHLPFTQALVSNKILEIACHKNSKWIVKEELLDKYREECKAILPDNKVDPEINLPIWTYVTNVRKKAEKKENTNLNKTTEGELNKSIKEDKPVTANPSDRKRNSLNEFFQPKGKKQCV